MKSVLTTSRRSFHPVSFEAVPFACLLVLASMLAIVGGLATSALFFGLLLVFSLLLLASRHFSTPSTPSRQSATSPPSE